MSIPLADLLIPATGRLIRWGITFLLGFAVLTFGGTPPWAAAVIILVALGLVLLWLIQAVSVGQLEFRPSPIDLPVGLFLALILLQLLIGYPVRLHQLDLDQRLLQAASANPGALPFVPGTLDFHATRWSLLFFLAYAACFYLVVHTVERREHLTRLLLFIVGMAGATGIYGLLEYLSGNQGILGWKFAGGSRVRGTFINPDHFGAFLAMALFAGIGMVIALGTRRRRRRGPREVTPAEDREEGDVRGPSASLTGPPQERIFQQVLLMFVVGLVGTALVFTMSRGALLSALIAGGIVAGILGMHESLGRRRLLGVAALLPIAGFVLWVGLGPVLDRFGEVSVNWPERLILYQQSLGIVRDFPLLGTGFGTFGEIFPRYQAPPLSFNVWYAHAHNDLLQLAAEGGIVALGILGLGLWGLLREIAVVRILGLARPVPPGAWPGARIAGSAAAIILGMMSPRRSRWVRDVAGGIGLTRSMAAGSSPLASSERTLPARSGQGSPAARDDEERKERSPRRRDPFNIGIALGGLGALVAVLIHGVGDFSLRIPANAILLSVLLGMTLQAARVRFHSYGTEHLYPVLVVPLRGRRGVWALAGGTAVVGWLSWITLTSAFAEARIASGAEMVEAAGGIEQARSDRPWVAWTRRSAGALSLLESAVSIDSVNPRGHLGIGRAYEVLALRAWNTGLSAEGRLLPEPAQRVEELRRLLSGALASFARAAYLAPMDRRAWGEIAWTHGLLARALPEASGLVEQQASLVAFRRAMALRPTDLYPFQLQADFAFQWTQAQRGSIPVEAILTSEMFRAGIHASRQLVELQPTSLPEALNRVLLFTTDFGVVHTVIPPHPPDFLFAARLLDDQGLSRQSRLALEMAVTLALDEDRPIFYQYLAEDLIRRGDLPGAMRHLEFVLGVDPQNIEVRLTLADALARQKLDDRALREYQVAVEIAKGLSTAARPSGSNSPAPSPPPTRLEIVEASLRERGLLPGGQRRDPLAKALAALASFHEGRGRPNDAIPLWQQAAGRSPQDPEIHFGYGESLDSAGAWIPAQSEYRKALELDPRNVSLRLRLADKYMRNGLSEQAMALWQDVTRLRPANVEARIRLAGVYEKLGRRKEAELEYDQVLQLEPGNEPARQALSRLRGRAPASRSSSS